MFHNLGWFIGLNYQVRSVKKPPDAKPRLAKVKPVAMLDTVQEIAIYIHRFHNLDLFQQGFVHFHSAMTFYTYLWLHLSSSYLLSSISSYRWYQIKLTMRWEDSEYTSVGTPARVVQYEGIFANFLSDWFISFLLMGMLAYLIFLLEKLKL